MEGQRDTSYSDLGGPETDKLTATLSDYKASREYTQLTPYEDLYLEQLLS